ncbi:ATP-binding protein [Streptomyces sp. NPDC057877]|uniref:ATP-binding protein n=1 Tax=Streptomyces sp. NPDC057877 TaxID=3346269 RepID=UPI003674AE48
MKPTSRPRQVPTAPLLLELVAWPKVLPGLRCDVRRYLGGPCADAELCVTELVGNVIRHVGEGSPVRVSVRVREAGAWAERRIRVEVTDPEPQSLPVLRRVGDEDESGRGLALLDAVASRWGVEQGVAEKTVWCEVVG